MYIGIRQVNKSVNNEVIMEITKLDIYLSKLNYGWSIDDVPEAIKEAILEYHRISAK